MKNEELKNCKDACEQCAIDCDACVSICKTETGHEQCVNNCTVCAEACRQFINAHIEGDEASIKVKAQKCADACEACAKECEKHTHMECCKKCAASCRKCAELCRKLAA